MKITDFKATYKDIDTAVRAAKMFELKKNISLSVLNGKYRTARKYQKELANAAANDFDTYKSLPFINVQLSGMPAKSFFSLALKFFRFKLFKIFTKKTPEEKQLIKLSKEYYSNLSSGDIKNKTIDITIPSLY